VGTVKYMSPEQARGEKMDHRTDIFSLGVVMYEAITGRVPFDGETPSHTIVAILEREPEPIGDYVPTAPAGLHRVVDNALRKKREDRYQTAGEMLNDLKELREEVAFRARQERHSGDVLNTETAVAAQSRAGQRGRNNGLKVEDL
jgi:serine/threonine protein kinase